LSRSRAGLAGWLLLAILLLLLLLLPLPRPLTCIMLAVARQAWCARPRASKPRASASRLCRPTVTGRCCPCCLRLVSGGHGSAAATVNDAPLPLLLLLLLVCVPHRVAAAAEDEGSMSSSLGQGGARAARVTVASPSFFVVMCIGMN
jgi:hypothetical protein